MADNITIKDGGGSNVTLGAKDVGSVFYPQSTPVTPAGVTMVGTAGSSAAGTMTIQGIASGTPVIVSDGGGPLSVDDAGGSLTIDGSVSISGTAAVAEAGTWVQVDDAAFTPATSKIAMVGATFDDVAPDSVNEGDGGAIRMSANRNLYATLRDAAGNERGMNIDANGDHGVTARSGAFASGALASGSIASGAIASGAIATGAIAAGAASIADNEDAVSSDGDRGVKILAVRKATAANTSGNDGDYEFLQMSAGALWTASAATDKTLLAQRTINGGAEYETVAASQTGQALGASGATGDYIAGVLVVPATTSPGNVLLLDNATSITIFTGGATSVSNLVPFFIPLGMISVSGAWKLTTGANVSCIGVGNFT